MTRPRPRRGAVLALALALTVAACSGGGSSSSGAEGAPTSATTPNETPAPAETTTTVDPATAQAWEQIDAELAGLGPDVSLLVARVAPDGTCEPVHEVDPTTARPIASQFKLFVLGALAEQVAAGEVSWDQTVTVREEDRSFGNGEGSLEKVEPGTEVTVEEAATKMISISDNTATDILIGLVGRDAVEAQAREWMADASANDPFLTTREMFLLHYVEGLAEQYLATPPDQRHDFLATEVDPRPLSDIYDGLDLDPHHVDTVEWFASAEDVCRAFVGLQDLATDPALAPLSTILSLQVAGIDLAPADWPTVWYKGGSEPGVLTLGWLATTAADETFVVEAMVTNPDAALAEDSITDLVALAQDAFALLG